MFSRYPITGVGPGNFIPYRVANLDGVKLEAHNLAGQVLGETGFLGAAAFAFMVAIALVNCQRARRLAGAGLDQESDILFGFASACRDTLLLLLFEGLFDHNMTRYNWLWVAAFVSAALRFAAAQNEATLFSAARETSFATAND
jgi:O-antigen ligase